MKTRLTLSVSAAATLLSWQLAWQASAAEPARTAANSPVVQRTAAQQEGQGAPAEAPAAAPPADAANPPSDTKPAVGGVVVTNPNQTKDEAQAGVEEKKEEKKLPFRKSILLLDQSMSTQTARIETSPQQSFVPLYEWWVSFRPRYYINDDLYVAARLDYFKELTNNGDTTKYREDVFGDIWTWVTYAKTLKFISEHTKGRVGFRALWPTSKASQANGTYVTAGPTAGITQEIPIKGEKAKWLPAAEADLGFGLTHPFTSATTASGGGFYRDRQDTEGRSFQSDQLRGGMLTNWQLISSLGGKLGITDKLTFGADMIFISQWKYLPKDAQQVTVAGGDRVDVARSSSASNFVNNTWFIASLDYDLMDEVGLTLGYYNLANQIGPSGERRGLIGGNNLWWSPDARVFFDVTVNLDKVYELAAGKKKKNTDAAHNIPAPLRYGNQPQVQ